MKTDGRGTRYESRFTQVDGITLVSCCNCGQHLPETEFILVKAKQKLHNRCNQCRKDQNNARYVKVGRSGAGAAAHQRMLNRRFVDGLWLCARCKEHKTEDQFRKLRNNKHPHSWCKQCTSEYHMMVTHPKVSQKNKERTRLKREEASNKTKQCDRCGNVTAIKYWPRQGRENSRLLKYCCSAKNRNYKDVEFDISVGSKVCKRCEVRKPFEQFSPHKDRKDGRQTVCRECRSSLIHSGTWDNTRRAQRKADASDGTLTPQIVGELFSVRNCPCCTGLMDRNDKVLDHIVPLSKGGAHSIHNVIVMCWRCNSEKAAHHPSKWLQMLRSDAADRMRIAYASMGLNFDE